MKTVILDYKSVGLDLPLEPLYKYGTDIDVWEATTPEQAKTRLAEAEILLINKFKVTEEILQCAPKLKLICEFATGFDNIDLSAARAHGVAVCNVPAYSTDSVALFTVTTALSLVTHLKEYSDFVRSGEYSASGVPNRLTPVYHELAGRTWGILGCGNIGGKVAEIASAFGMNILVTKRTPSEKYKTVHIDTLCRESDILSIHCPLNDSTRGIINAERLSKMKKTAILVNEARGAVVDEAAVAEAVKNGTIGGLGADVFGTEPFGHDHPYYEIKDYPNVVFTPHTAWSAYEARVRCLSIITENIDSYLSGGRKNRVD